MLICLSVGDSIFLGVEPAACSKWLLTDERNKYNLSSERVLISRTDTPCVIPYYMVHIIFYTLVYYASKYDKISSWKAKNLALWLDGRSHLLDQKGRSLNKVTKINFYFGFWTVSWDKKIMNKTKSGIFWKNDSIKNLRPSFFRNLVCIGRLKNQMIILV